MEYLLEQTRDSLRQIIAEWDEQAYRADQILEWVYKRSVQNPLKMENLPANLRERMVETFAPNPIAVRKVVKSQDGSVKTLFKSRDALFEAVAMPSDDSRNTFCLSTQYGCPIGCKFCETGNMGFKRNLTAAEMVSQVLELEKQTSRPDNVVLMGMGEALMNFEAVDRFIEIISHPKGYALSKRRITLSTSGLMTELLEFHKLHPQVELAISLNAADNKTRKMLMPNNLLADMKSILATVEKLDCDVTFEYVLLDGINSSIKDAENLAKILRGKKNVKVNLIGFNKTSVGEFKPPNRETIINFQNKLREAGVICFIRKSMGSDIAAACGQLTGRDSG